MPPQLSLRGLQTNWKNKIAKELQYDKIIERQLEQNQRCSIGCAMYELSGGSGAEAHDACLEASSPGGITAVVSSPHRSFELSSNLSSLPFSSTHTL